MSELYSRARICKHAVLIAVEPDTLRGEYENETVVEIDGF